MKVTGINLRQKRDVGKIISDSFNYLRYHFKYLFKMVLMVSGPIFLIGGVLFGVSYSGLISNSMGAMAANQTSFTIKLIVGILFMGIGAVVMNGLIVEYMRESLEKPRDEITFKGIIQKFKEKSGQYFFVSIILIVMLSLSVFVFVLPMIWLSVVFSLVFFLIGIEKRTAFNAIGQSFKLINGFWWRSFALFFLTGMIQTGFLYALMIPIYAIVYFTMLSGNDPIALQQKISILSLFYMPLFMIISSLSYSLTTIASGINYFSIIEVKEELGLKQRIEGIETNN